MERAEEEWGVSFPPDQVVVVGDTPMDVECGRHVGARTLAVATGRRSVEELTATGPDWVLIAANEHPVGIAFDVSNLPAELNGKTLYRLYSDEAHKIQQGKFRDGIRALNVHVYATSRRFQVK